MKSFTLLFLVFLATGSTCQVIVSANNHFKLFQNYTSNGKEYISQREQPMLFEGILNTSFVLKTYKKTYISVGLSYKRVKFEVKDVIKGIEYRIFDNNDNIIDSGFFESHMNYRNTSNNFGLSFEYGYQLSDKKWKKVQLGLNLSTYVFS